MRTNINLILLIVAFGCTHQETNFELLTETTWKANVMFGEVTKGDMIEKITYKYNSKGNEIEINKYKSDETLWSKTTTQYDDKENKIQEKTYKSDGTLKSLTNYQYGNTGDIMKITSEDGVISLITIHRYDNKGNEIEMNGYEPDLKTLIAKTTIQYDDLGNKVEVNAYKPDGTIILRTTFRYDDKGNEIEQNVVSADETLLLKLINRYEFDENGNWVLKITYNPMLSESIPYRITEREIKYSK